MTKEREYRAYAGTCVDLANKATNDKDKKHLLAMAEAWLGLVRSCSATSSRTRRWVVAARASGQALALSHPARFPSCGRLFSMLMPFTLPHCSR